MTYDLKAERAKYCENDVMILKKCCESFRELFKGITNFDPFSYTTLPAVSIADFRINHMIEDTIPIVYLPVQKNSKMAVQWLEYVAAKEGISIIHDANYGEYYFPDLHLWVDGYCDETKTIYSFLGCYFHACPQCYPNDRDRIDSRFGKTLNELFSDTKTRFKRLKKKGKIVVIWECEFKKLQNQPDFSIFKKDYKHIGRLNPRDAFYGGRTNATKLFYECKPGERIRDLDFTSIYSACMRNQKFPTCHPIILAGNDLKGKTDITEYFGLIKCTVVAPRKLYHPVLPVKTDKLCFPLCVLCCETQTRHCTHGWTKREFMGTWFSEELNLALEKGYRIIRLHEVHHFPETRTDLFNEYIEKWLKVKLESTGYLKHLKSEEEKLQYIEYIFVKEHIRLDPSKIIDNKGLRMIAKNMLNSLYGRFGQRPSYPETKYVNAKEDSALYNKIVFNRKKYEVRHIRKIGDDMVQICYDHRDVFKNKENFGSSVYIALMTSARARIKLYRLLDILGDRVIYFDTDSVKFVEQIGENLLPIGDGLGELTDEVDEGYYISRFISTGPKSLCYELTSIADMNDKKYIIKLKGITLNSGNLAKVNFDEMKKILLGENDVIKFVNLSKIVRNPSTLEIRNRVESKDYKLVYTKRVVQEDIKDGVEEGCVDTLPFGF